MIDEHWQDQQRQDDEERRREVERVLLDYSYGLTSKKGFDILCRECGINKPELRDRFIKDNT
ncbi:MAG: hypothetical protein PHE50_00135 [Dehalococcoidales bacterium]|nr:hypothetical protein [Dehalococcoidales bacterium]